MGWGTTRRDDLLSTCSEPAAPDLDKWIQGHARQRYGKSLPKAEAAWKGFLETVYRQSGRERSIVCMRPSLPPKDLRGGGPTAYDLAALAAAWGNLAAYAPELKDVDAYQYDLVHVTRQVLSDLAGVRLKTSSWGPGPTRPQTLFARRPTPIWKLFDDLDRLLATRGEVSAGRWIEDASAGARTTR
jgi:alpha-N-acetylglucosaminidase